MPLVDELLAQREKVSERELADASNAATWTKTFNRPNSVENLRAQANVTDLIAQALDRKQQLEATRDLNAARIYQTNERTRQMQESAPLRDDLTRAQTAAQGATAKLRDYQDAQTMSHVAGLADYMTRAPEIGSPEYHAYALRGVQQFPRASSTQWFQQDFRDAIKAHDALAVIPKEEPNLYSDPPTLLNENRDAEYRQDPKSGKFYVLKSGGKANLGTIPSGALTELGKLAAERSSAAYYSGIEADPKKQAQLTKKIGELDAKIAGLHSTFGDGKTPPPAASEVKSASQANDKVMVEKNGKRFRLPSSQLQDALSQGFSAVK